MSVAYIFPGQGSQYAGMGKDLAENFPAARKVFEKADEALGFPLSRLCFDGPAAELQLTENTQPAILATSIAASEALKQSGALAPDYVLGHSLGEYSALVVSGALAFADAIKIVRARGRYMQEAVPVGTGAMAAILGATLPDIESACAEASQGEVCAPANINSPNQVVIAGHVAAVDRAGELLKTRGAKKVVKLNVSAPFHCPLMLPAQQRLAVDLDETAFADLKLPLVTNVDAQILYGSGAAARDALVRQVSSPVRWLASIELLIAQGVTTFVEVGPGKVLTGLLRQISREVKSFNVENAATLKAALEGLT
jgi:[acyl-carrier-protein] S-malonyltransferase